MTSRTLPYPKNSVWAIVDHDGEADAASAEVHRMLPADRITCYQGAKDADEIRSILEHHGWLTKLAAWAHGEEMDVKRYALAAEEGAHVIRVDLEEPDELYQARDALLPHGARFINYYGNWSEELLSP